MAERLPKVLSAAAMGITGLFTISCVTDFTTGRQPVRPEEREKSIVLTKPDSSPTPPSEPGKRVGFGTPESTLPSLKLQDLQAYLKYPTIISIGGESYVRFMEKEGNKIHIYESQTPYKGAVVPQEGLTTHLLPITDSKIASLDERYSLKQGPIQGELKYFVEVKKRDGIKKELWVARLQRVSMGNNPSVLALVFNAVEFKGGGSGKTVYINLEKSVPNLK